MNHYQDIDDLKDLKKIEMNNEIGNQLEKIGLIFIIFFQLSAYFSNFTCLFIGFNIITIY